MRLPKKLLSYSSVSMFNKTSTHRQWILRYIYKEQPFVIAEMALGRRMSENLEKEDFFDWDSDLKDTLSKAPMYGEPEQVLVLQQSGFAVNGYVDRATHDFKRCIEYKTGKRNNPKGDFTGWDQERVDKDRQMETYSWLIYENFGYIPEFELCWFPTEGQRDSLRLTGEVERFKRVVSIDQIKDTENWFNESAIKMSKVYQLYLDGHDLYSDAKKARDLIKTIE